MEVNINTAIRKGYFQQVRVLAKLGYDVNVRDAAGRTPLVNCALVDSDDWGVGLARTLLEHGARPAMRDRLGLTALHYSCIHRRPRLVGVLLTAADFDLAAVDRRGNTALHYAAATGDRAAVGALVAALLRYGRPVDRPNVAGRTALEFAYRTENVDCAALIRDAGVKAAAVAATRGGCVDGSPSAGADSCSDGRADVERTGSSTDQVLDERIISAFIPQNGSSVRRDSSSCHSTAVVGHPASSGRWKAISMDVETRSTHSVSLEHGQHIDFRPSQGSCVSVVVTAAASDDDSVPPIADQLRQVSDVEPQQTQSRDFSSPTTATATSARQLRAERRPRDAVRDQFLSLQTVRPQLAVRASRRMLKDGAGGGVNGRSTDGDRSETPSGVPGNGGGNDDDELIPKAAVAVRLFRPAPENDPHNQPLPKLLQKSAVEFFGGRNFDSGACLIGGGDYPIEKIRMSSRDSDRSDWRAKMRQLYNKYDYQFTSSYRQPAVGRLPRHDGSNVDDGVGPLGTRNSSTSDATAAAGFGKRGSARKPSASVKFGGGDGLTAVDSACRKKSAQQLLQSAAMAASLLASKSKRSSSGTAPTSTTTTVAASESAAASESQRHGGGGSNAASLSNHGSGSAPVSGLGSRKVSSLTNAGGLAGVAGLPHGLRRPGEAGERDGRG